MRRRRILLSSISEQKIDLKQLIANINPGISEDKLTTLETKLIDNSEIQKQIVGIKQQLLNVVDKTQLENLKPLISKLDDKITKQKIDLKQLIDNIKPVFRVKTSETTYQLEGYGFILKIKVFLYISGNVKNIFDDTGNFNFRVHINKINDSKEEISLASVKVTIYSPEVMITDKRKIIGGVSTPRVCDEHLNLVRATRYFEIVTYRSKGLLLTKSWRGNWSLRKSGSTPVRLCRSPHKMNATPPLIFQEDQERIRT
ncbi:hypothetical protein LOTGIDRAFT_163210 [Lottia gigantea]|uniref:Uncharacterized protein n=1 Tax=Lottia gigantea TaxID=225164 RepID=V4AEV8_LOTGI|nr:hypothetical protein LOTGIDRAFT_163210 [Lottia gigantea]ESO91851.1 hypothetical protein LOTGIDRAFT_163210 [Lottia gigantea]